MAAMESHVTNYLKLDQEFDKCLAEMKPHVLKLPHKTGEQTIINLYVLDQIFIMGHWKRILSFAYGDQPSWSYKTMVL